MTPAALALQGIGKRFGNVTALKDATLTVRAGTVHALLGENGAGKTTLMRIAFGMVRPDSGTVQIDGARIELQSPGNAIAAGVGMVHQHFALVPTMTVAENVALGRTGRYSARDSADLVRRIGDSSGLVLDPDALASELSVGAQQRLEIVKALARDVRILILDEPTAVLAPAEIGDLLARLRAFADSGRTVVLITHKLREALSIADEVTVLRHGATVLGAPSTEASEATLAAAILGRAVGGGQQELGAELDLLAGSTMTAAAVEITGTDRTVELTSQVGPTTNLFVDSDATISRLMPNPRLVFQARNLWIADSGGAARLRDATFTVHAGEIVGIAAVEGAGHHELMRVLAGRMEPSAGTLVRPATIGFVPEDRQREGLILEFSLAENVALRDAGRRRGRIRWRDMARRTGALLSGFDIRAGNPQVAASTLSGGTQQKLVMARELENGPDALIVESPTRGLDIRASADVHARLRAAAVAGTAVVVHSSDLDELLALATRVLVVFAGSVRAVRHDRDEVGRGMLGLA